VLPKGQDRRQRRHRRSAAAGAGRFELEGQRQSAGVRYAVASAPSDIKMAYARGSGRRMRASQPCRSENVTLLPKTKEQATGASDRRTHPSGQEGRHRRLDLRDQGATPEEPNRLPRRSAARQGWRAQGSQKLRILIEPPPAAYHDRRSSTSASRCPLGNRRGRRQSLNSTTETADNSV